MRKKSTQPSSHGHFPAKSQAAKLEDAATSSLPLAHFARREVTPSHILVNSDHPSSTRFPGFFFRRCTHSPNCLAPAAGTNTAHPVSVLAFARASGLTFRSTSNTRQTYPVSGCLLLHTTLANPLPHSFQEELTTNSQPCQTASIAIRHLFEYNLFHPTRPHLQPAGH